MEPISRAQWVGPNARLPECALSYAIFALFLHHSPPCPSPPFSWLGVITQDPYSVLIQSPFLFPPPLTSLLYSSSPRSPRYKASVFSPHSFALLSFRFTVTLYQLPVILFANRFRTTLIEPFQIAFAEK